jgi:hypothetical protein
MTSHWSEHTTVIKHTFISVKTYSKVRKLGIEITLNPNPSTSDKYFYLRNDTLNKKVYSFENGVDSLFYDFSLTIVDTMPRTGWIIDTLGSASQVMA